MEKEYEKEYTSICITKITLLYTETNKTFNKSTLL